MPDSVVRVFLCQAVSQKDLEYVKKNLFVKIHHLNKNVYLPKFTKTFS